MFYSIVKYFVYEIFYFQASFVCVVVFLTLDLDTKEVEYVEKVVYKALKASRKNLEKTKDEQHKIVITESINSKKLLLKKIRQALKENEAGR